MPHTTFPQDSDIAAKVQTLGVAIPAGFVFTGYGAMAQREFEQRTFRLPFLADSVDVTRTFDPPGGKSSFLSGPFAGVPSSYSTTPLPSYGGAQYLEFDAGLVSITSFLKDVTSATPSGTALIQGQDFILTPANAVAQGLPYTGAQILVPFWGQRKSVRVIGKWGYSANLPEDVWQCCIDLGAAQALEDMLQGIYGSATTFRAGEDMIQTSANKEMGAQIRKRADRVIEFYKLVVMGL